MIKNCFFIILCVSICSATATDTNKNVLVILIDDLRHLSEKNVTLPNISKIAAKGVKFKNAFAQQALCAPSRNSLLTGRRPDSLRLYDFFSYWRDSIGSFTTLPQFFKDNGYETFSVGKVFHPGLSSNFTDDYPLSWSHKPYHPPTDIYKDAAVCKDHRTKELQNNLICPVTVHKQPEKTLPDLQSLKYAVNILKNRKNAIKPYFLAVGFHKPHIPFKFPKEFLYSTPISEIQQPIHPHMPKNLPSVAWHPWTDIRSREDIRQLNIPFPFGTMPKQWTLKIRQSYFAAAKYVDSLIDVLMSYVDLRKTIVILTSDHGWSLGENGLWAKYSNFDVALKVPLIFLKPGLRPKTIDTPVELIDIFPTLVDLASLSNNIPKCKNNADKTLLCFAGKSLVPLMLENGTIDSCQPKNSDARANYTKAQIKQSRTTKNEFAEFAISQYPRPSEYPQRNSDKPRLKTIKIMGYSIRTKRYRYTEWISFNNTSFKINWNNSHGVELYDHIIDPEESDNLNLVLKYKYVKNILSNMLKENVK